MRRLLLALALLAQAGAAQASGFVGAYIWGGALSKDSGVQGFYDSVGYALAEGFTTIRFTLAPGQATSYNISPDPCASTQSLACYAGVMFASSVWDNPNLTRVMFTAHDFTGFVAGGNSNNGYLTPSLLTANAAAIEAEYTALFNVLKTRFAGRSIQFVISNWEADNLIYCGSAYSFSAGGSFASTCQSSFVSGQTNAQRVQAFLQWVSYKDAAVAAFVAANPGFNLISAPEFSNFGMFASGCGGYCNGSTDTVLDQIGIAGGRAYCSYSSYDSMSGPGSTFITNVRAILNTCANLIIGEEGADLDTTPPATIVNYFQALAQINSLASVLGVIPWHFVDSAGSATAYGLFTATGAPQQYPLLGGLRPARPAVASYR